MIDIEAMGNSPDSIILTVAAQLFDPLSHGWVTEVQWDQISQQHYEPSLYVHLDYDEQESQYRRTTDKVTIDWWSKQSPEAQDEAFGDRDRLSMKAAMTKLCLIASPPNCNRIWCKGSTYDITLLENAIRQAGLIVPWKFWAVRDARTVYKLVPGLNDKLNGHIALDDCRNQIILLQEALRLLGVTEIK